MNEKMLSDEASNTKETKCIYCAKATNSGCSWSADYDPVPGWKAKRTLNSFAVQECPEYVSDRHMNHDPEKLDTEGCIELLESMMKLMKEDYMDLPDARRQIEAFIRNPSVRKLFFFCEPADLIKLLRKEAAVRDERKKLKP